ncbi:flagellar protein [Aneurinibacillus sp. Ricciae_BoGa-3]|uniref:TIGR03826 family flagellar region protein n=1 Tax=Aneurinibacillus sp. Ricciae_BoGa-3 TaxID=3022697 RepID=UPI00233F8EFB|nr:TIGR03826 family flagellar region protein [Aneurinibacillus sp. Ricciae_BoGa-3]WCK54202.1 flagellar protein [Aneurinibacillus sp. Ricciae_BoGa-3]
MPSLDNVTNCPRCGKIFMKIRQPVCPSCVKEIDKEYEKCSQFLRKKENRGCTVYELSEKTGVNVEYIKQFIREGRLSIDNAPNLGYSCDSCGRLIRSGSHCTSCQSERNKLADSFHEEVKRKADRQESNHPGKLYRTGLDQ